MGMGQKKTPIKERAKALKDEIDLLLADVDAALQECATIPGTA